MELRNSTLDALFDELKNIGIPINENAFMALSRTYDSPEEMAMELVNNNESQYITLFPILSEIWRRLCPDKYTISIFGQELDHLIEEYEQGTLENPEDLYQAVAQLQAILEEHSEHTTSPQAALEVIQQYVDYELESFLYIYILNELENGDPVYAADLLEGFYSFVLEKSWFDYLDARIEMTKDLDESLETGYEKLENLIEDKLLEEQNLDLNFEVLQYLAQSGHHSLFLELALPSIALIETEEDFLDYAEITKEHFQTLELKTLADQTANVIALRQPRPLNMPFNPEDPDLIQIHKILTQKVLVL